MGAYSRLGTTVTEPDSLINLLLLSVVEAGECLLTVMNSPPNIRSFFSL